MAILRGVRRFCGIATESRLKVGIASVQRPGPVFKVSEGTKLRKSRGSQWNKIHEIDVSWQNIMTISYGHRLKYVKERDVECPGIGVSQRSCQRQRQRQC